MQHIPKTIITITVAHSTATYVSCGFFVSDDGYIVTTLNTIRLNTSTGPIPNIIEATCIFVSMANTNNVYKATFIGYNTICDIALLKININTCDFLMISSRNLDYNETIYTHYNKSNISGKLLSNYEITTSLISCIKTDIQYTVDGSPLFSSSGKCVGLISKMFNTDLCCGPRGAILKSFVSIMIDYNKNMFCCDLKCEIIQPTCINKYPNIKVMNNGVLQYIIGYVDNDVQIIQNNIVERIKIGDIPTDDINDIYGCYVMRSVHAFQKGDIITHIDNEKIMGTICDLTWNKQLTNTINIRLNRKTKSLVIPYKLVPYNDTYITNTNIMRPVSHDIITSTIYNTCVDIIVPITAYVNNTIPVSNFTGWIHNVINNRLIIITSAHSVLNEHGITHSSTQYESFTCDITHAYISKLDGSPAEPTINKITASIRILGMDIASDICVMYTINPAEQTEIEHFGHYFDSQNATLPVSTKQLLPGDTVYALSNMYGYGLSMNSGYIQDNDIIYRPGTTTYMNQTSQMVTSLPLTGGASGAPVLLYDRNLGKGVLAGMVNWSKITNSYTGGPNYQMIIKVYIRIINLNISTDLKILPERKNFDGSTGKGYIGIESYLFTDGNVLTELNAQYTKFAESIYSKQCSGCYITKINNIYNKIPNSGIRNAINITEQSYINKIRDSTKISTENIKLNDIILEINNESLGIGLYDSHITSISYFSGGKYIYAKILRPETAEILYFRILCDEYPLSLEYVSYDDTIELIGKVKDFFNKLFGITKNVTAVVVNELNPYSIYTNNPSGTTQNIVSNIDKIANGNTVDVLTGYANILNPSKLLGIPIYGVLNTALNGTNDIVIGKELYDASLQISSIVGGSISNNSTSILDTLSNISTIAGYATYIVDKGVKVK